jgi:hypothetical protein
VLDQFNHHTQMGGMTDWLINFWDYHFWASISLFSVLCLSISIFAERRRMKRTRIEDVGFMPWNDITVLSTLISLIAIALAIKTEYLGG